MYWDSLAHQERKCFLKKNLSCKTRRITYTTGGEGKDQQEALNLQQIKCKQCGGPSKLQICPFPYGNEIQCCTH